MARVYVLLYIHTDAAPHSEVIGVYENKDLAVNALLECANYREKNGQLTQYMEPTDEYDSFQALRDQVYKDMELNDVDIYRISEHRVTETPSKEQYSSIEADIDHICAAK